MTQPAETSGFDVDKDAVIRRLSGQIANQATYIAQLETIADQLNLQLEAVKKQAKEQAIAKADEQPVVEKPNPAP